MDIPHNPGARTMPWMQPGGSQLISMTWPGVTFPWALMPWGEGALTMPATIELDGSVFSVQKLRLADARNMNRILRSRSFPIAQASHAAVALYQSGFYDMARGIMNVYGGIYGVVAVREQIMRVYRDGCNECPVAHYHQNDPTCRAGGSGDEPGAQNGPHFHVYSLTCTAGDPYPGDSRPGICQRPHHHVGDYTWRSAGG